MSGFKDEEHAKEIGNKTKAKLEKEIGGDWEVKTHQNGGWYLSLYFGAIGLKVYYRPGDLCNYEYSVLVDDTGKYRGTGAGHFQRPKSGIDPVAVIKEGLVNAKEKIELYQKHVIEDTYSKLKF